MRFTKTSIKGNLGYIETVAFHMGTDEEVIGGTFFNLEHFKSMTKSERHKLLIDTAKEHGVNICKYARVRNNSISGTIK